MKHINSKNPPESSFRASLSVVVLVVFSILAIALPGYGQQGGVITELTSSGLGTEIVLPPSGGNVYNINGGTVKTGSLGNNLRAHQEAARAAQDRFVMILASRPVG